MRTLRFTEPPSRTRSTRCAAVSPVGAGWFSNSENSGATSIKRRPTSCASSKLNSCAALRFVAVMRPFASSPMTPALTPPSTASMKLRRVSASSCAVTRSRRCVSSCAVMRLNAAPSASISSRSSPMATRAFRSPDATRRAAPTSRPIGSATRVALVKPTQPAASNTISAVQT